METNEPTRKTRAIVFSDIKGYSKLMGEDESLALRMLEEHNSICVPLVKKCGGAILKFMGDAILSSFESASDAVHCGITIQRALAQRNAKLPKPEHIVVRIGIHIGDVVMKDGDVFGDGVNIAARIEPLAEPGGIAISQTVFDMIKARPEIQTVSLGPKELKNIKDAVNIYQVLIEAQSPGLIRRLAWAGKLRMLLLAIVAAAVAAGGVVAVKFLKKGEHSEAASNLLPNPGFEQGVAYWRNLGGSVAVVDNAALAHSGGSFAEFHSEPGSQSNFFATDSSGEMFFPVNPGDVLTWSAWGYRISGDGIAQCNIQATTDVNGANPSWASAVPKNVTAGFWTQQKGSYTIGPGKCFYRFYCTLARNTVPAAARFDDIYLHITPASQAGGVAAPASLPVAAAPASPVQQPAPAPAASPAASGAAAGSAVGIEWARVPAGSFMIGSADHPESQPVHRVTVKAFELAKAPVTFRQYRACVEAGACEAPHVSDGRCRVTLEGQMAYGSLPLSRQGDEQPVVCVDWDQAKKFSAWVGGRLPSEAEWEYAVRSAGAECPKPGGGLVPDLCEASGDVSGEWLQDWYHDSYKGAPADGSAWVWPAGAKRVNRHGPWNKVVGSAALAGRRDGYDNPTYCGEWLGLRPARDRRD